MTALYANRKVSYTTYCASLDTSDCLRKSCLWEILVINGHCSFTPSTSLVFFCGKRVVTIHVFLCMPM